MSRFNFQLATRSDDAQLRKLLAKTPMDGDISLAFAREPHFFDAAELEGDTIDIGVVRDRTTGEIVGMGSRSIGFRYVNGDRVPVGYLGGLRLEGQHRGRAGLLARGYQFLRRLHTDGRASYYLTTIAEQNVAAVSVLCSRRAGLPVYRPWGRYHTFVLSSKKWPPRFTSRDRSIEIRPAQAGDRSEIVRFLNEYGPRRQFFPVYETKDLFSDAGKLKGLQPEDVFLAVDRGDIVGTIGSWNQRAFKQTVVHSYRGWIRTLRPLHNAWAAVVHQPQLPAVGKSIDACSAAIPVVRDDDVGIFEQLLRAAVQRMARQHCSMLLVGLHENDPLLTFVRRHAGREYVTRVYLVHWPDEAPPVERLSVRIPYLELGCL